MTQKYILKPDLFESPLKLSLDYEKELNSSQWEVVSKADGPALVLAGAGSGKTRTLIYRVAYLLDKGVRPDEILLVTFTNKAAQEMKSRIETLLKSNSKGLWCGTFHHIANRLLHQYGSKIGLRSDFGILDDEDSRDIVKHCVKSIEPSLGGVKLPKATAIQTILSFSVSSGRSIADTVSKQYPHFMPLVPAFQKIKAMYEDKKKRTGNLDYDDLLTTWLELIKPGGAAHEALTQKFRYCLVDEFQDTNRLQNEIVQTLAMKHRNLLVVGDDAQSIYSFRAADIQNILNFPKKYTDAKIFHLDTNYRSSRAILDLANSSIKNNLQQFPKQLKSIHEEGEMPQLVRVRDWRQEAQFISQRLSEFQESGIDTSEMAILFRAHYQAAELELELSKKGIPYIVRGGVRFFEQAHIKDVLSYLRIISNPMDELAWARALTLEPGLGPATADKIFLEVEKAGADLKKVFAPDFADRFSSKAREGFSKFKNTLKRVYGDGETLEPDRMIEAVLESAYSKYVLLNFENARERLDDLKQLVNFAHSYKSLKEFLPDVTLREGFRGESFTEDEPPRNEERPLVLSTIHQAKGLEWKVVFIISLSEGQFPHARAMQHGDNLEEERRLFYVASTRAKNHLVLTHPMMRYDAQVGMVIQRPSPFILELPSKLYDELEIEEQRNEETIYLDEE